MKRNEAATSRTVPFFARYLQGQETDLGAPKGKPQGNGRTLKFPSDWDEWDWTA